MGGNSPQLLVADAAAAIGRGDLDVALVCGAEAVATRWKAAKTKAWLDWSQQELGNRVHAELDRNGHSARSGGLSWLRDGGCGWNGQQRRLRRLGDRRT